jgi:hypothetical protein
MKFELTDTPSKEDEAFVICISGLMRVVHRSATLPVKEGLDRG